MLANTALTLVSTFGKAFCDMARALCRLFVGIADITDDEKDALWRACTDKAQIANAGDVADAIYDWLAASTVRQRGPR